MEQTTFRVDHVLHIPKVENPDTQNKVTTLYGTQGSNIYSYTHMCMHQGSHLAAVNRNVKLTGKQFVAFSESNTSKF